MKSGKRFHTEPLFLGRTSNIELMGVNVNNLYKTQLGFCYF